MLESQRSYAYQFTISDLNDQRLIALKANAKITNLYRFLDTLETGEKTSKQRISVRARLGKNSPYAFMYSSKGGIFHRYSGQNIRHAHGQYFDVYLHEVFN